MKVKESFENYKKVYQMLEDEESRDIYLSRLSYLLSGEYKYIENILTSYMPDISSQRQLIERLLADLPASRGIVLYGAGGKGAQVLQFLKGDKRFIGFCSNNQLKQAAGYLGYPVMKPEELLKRKDLTVLVAAPSARMEILEILKHGNYPEGQIYDLDAAAWSADPKQYFGPDFITYEDEEIFVDAGSYDLSTSLNLRGYCKCLKRVYAFEPDPANYERCLAQKEKNHFCEAEIFPFGTWDKRTTIFFSAKGNTSSKVYETGGNTITAVPIDDLIHPEDRVTFMKMDVEGAELESLRGAQKTIRRDRPKLAVCIYHKTTDMVEIPLFIKELVPEYKLYIRMHANDGTETVLYAVCPSER